MFMVAGKKTVSSGADGSLPGQKEVYQFVTKVRGDLDDFVCSAQASVVKRLNGSQLGADDAWGGFSPPLTLRYYNF